MSVIERIIEKRAECLWKGLVPHTAYVSTADAAELRAEFDRICSNAPVEGQITRVHGMNIFEDGRIEGEPVLECRV